MKKATYCLSLLLFLVSNTLFAQSIEDPFPQKKMRRDLEVFKSIRFKANSGLYKYRTKKQIDSIYNWADKQIDKSSTYRDFYNIICHLTDFEGSLHNDTSLPAKFHTSLSNEKSGYFPYPIKWIGGKWIVNYNKGEIPLGVEIISINNERIGDIVKDLYKYYTTDGVNITGKRVGLEYSFSKYYRLNYGLTNAFLVEFKLQNSNEIINIDLESVGFVDYYRNVKCRYSKPFDEVNYKDWREKEIYNYQLIDKETGILTINDFGMGNEKDQRHLKYVSFLDSVFASVKKNNIKNLIVDVRYNGGGTDPNDVITYSYLTSRVFQESKQVWISFEKIPLIRHYDIAVPKFLRPFGIGKYNKQFQKRFPIEKSGKYYISPEANEMRVRSPNENTFNGQVYLLISPRTASAGSLFAAMVAGNDNTITIGEETMGGYYGHNGHTSFEYILPKSKMVTMFSIDNIDQDVSKKENQKHDRGIIPDYDITQTYEDYLNHKDTQVNFTIDLIKKN